MAASLLAPLTGLARSARRTGFEPCLEIIEQRQGFFCAASLPLIRWFAPDIGLYSINRADAVEGFLGDGGTRLEPMVEIQSQRLVLGFTHWIRHRPTNTFIALILIVESAPTRIN